MPGDLKKSREKSNNQKKSQKSSGDQGCPPSTPTGVPCRVDEEEIPTTNRMELKLESPPTSKIQSEPAGESTDHSNAPAPSLCEDLLPPGGLTDKVQSEEEAASADLDQERDETQGGGCSETTPPSPPKEEDSKEEKKQHDSLNLTR